MLSFCDFPPHVRLMLLCARTRPASAEIARLVADPAMRWQEFLGVVAHHRVGPLVFNGLVGQTLPAEVQEALHRSATENAFEALRSTREVQRIARLYAEAGIKLSVLKGVPLSQLLFGSPNARHVGDIDLLAPATELPRQIGLLGEAGYGLVNPSCRLTPARIASYVTFWKDFTLRNLTAGFELDLHWRLFNNRFHAANPMLTQASYSTVEVFGVAMRVFSPRDQFIYIAAHGISDAWTYLKGLADVAGFLNLFSVEELDAALVRAEELGLLAQISAAIHLSNDWMGTTAASARLLPATDEIAVRVRARTTAALLKHDFRPHRDHTSPAAWLALELKLVPGVRSVVEVAKRFMWRPRVWKSVDLPDGLFWLYPALGLLLLPRQHGSAEDKA